MADTALEHLNDQLQPIYTNLTNLQGVQTNAVTKQQDMLNIIDFEQQRLQQKQETIDKAVENQKRIIYFNDNSRKVYSAWLNILMTITIGLGVIYVIRILHTHYGEIIPEMIFNIAMIVAISIVVIICYKMWSDIRARNNYNFDELDLSPPVIGVSKNNSGGFGLGSLVGCVGSQCCSPPTKNGPGTKWDPSIGRCLHMGALSSPTDDSDSSPTSIPTISPTTAPYSSLPPVVNPPSSSPPPKIKQGFVGANEAFETGYSIV